MEDGGGGDGSPRSEERSAAAESPFDEADPLRPRELIPGRGGNGRCSPFELRESLRTAAGRPMEEEGLASGIGLPSGPSKGSSNRPETIV